MRKAISPIIATIVLVAITIVGGLLIYSFFYGTSGILQSKGQISVEAMDLVSTPSGTVFSITVKNTGNKPATSVKVTLASESEEELLTADLQPGQSVSSVLSSLTGTYTIGESYPVVIKAEFSDGSTFAYTTSVICRYG